MVSSFGVSFQSQLAGVVSISILANPQRAEVSVGRVAAVNRVPGRPGFHRQDSPRESGASIGELGRDAVFGG